MPTESSLTPTAGSPTCLWDTGVVAHRLSNGRHLLRVDDDRLLGVLSLTADLVAWCLTPVAGVERALAVGLAASPVVRSVSFGTLRVHWRQEVTVPAEAIGDDYGPRKRWVSSVSPPCAPRPAR